MAEIVSIKVEATGVKAVTKELQNLKLLTNELNGKVIKIKIDLSGLQALDNQTLKTVRGITDLARQTAKLEIQQTKQAQAAAKQAAAEAKLAASQRQTTSATQSATGATKQYSKATEEATGLTKLMGASLGEIAAKMTAWMVMGNIVAGVVRSFRDAVTTLKEVDSALVTVQKTTGFSGQQLDALTEKTYELAAAYGRTADELMNLSADFARAGFGDQIEQMTELAALLENVGDLEGDTASKFLLAANAAWQLGGDYDSLMEIIDGMNAVTNQAAVDMEALTNGITVAGSVFANAGETAQTYTAMVGTAVAATQRSGNEIARGLRTIAMNVRQIKGELEDGEIIDEESISNAAKALSSVGISVADANGELRLTSDVLSDLAGKWDTLTTAEQAYLAESLAGKRQANILTALMRNWGEVERQMELYANGAGSALKENEIYLDSWEAKSKQLTATWTQFISHLIDTKHVKVAIDLLSGFIKILDSGVGKAAVFAAAIYAVITVVKRLTTAVKMLNVEMLSSPLVIATAIAATVYTLVTVIDKLTVSTKEAVAAMRDAKSAYEDATNQIESLNEKLRQNIDLIVEANMAGKDDSYKNRLIEENEQLREQIEEQLTLAEIKRQEAADNASIVAQRAMAEPFAYTNGTGPTYGNLPSLITKGPSAEDVESWIEARDELQSYISEMYAKGVPAAQKYHDALANVNEQIDIYTENQRANNEAVNAAVEKYKILFDAMEEISTSGKVSSETLQTLINEFPGFNTELISASGNAGELATVLLGMTNQLLGGSGAAAEASATMQRFATSLNSAADPAEWLAAILNEDQSAFNDEADAAVNAAIQTQFFALKAALANNQKINTSASISNLSGLEGQSYNTAAALQALITVFGQVAALDASVSHFTNLAADTTTRQGQHAANMLAAAASRRAGFDVSAAFMEAYNKAISSAPKVGYNGGNNSGNAGSGGRSGGSGSQKDQILEAHKSRVSLLEAELALMKERGDSEDDIVAQQRLIQQALHDEAEYLRTIEGESENVVKLSTDWWKIENDINKTLEEISEKRLKELEEQYKSMKEEALGLIDAAEEAATGPLQRQLDILKERQNTIKEEREEQEKILAVEKARIALENAQRERNVRQYNARTGQWEWVANAKNVESARNALDEAQKNLSDFYMDRAISALEKNIETIKESYQAMRDSVEEFAKRVESGAESIENAIEYLAKVIGGFTGTDDDGGTLVATPTGEHLGDKFGITTPSKSTAAKTGTTLGEHTFGIDFRGGSGGSTGSSRVDSVIASIASGGIGAANTLASTGSLASAGIVTSGVDTFVSHSTGVSRSTIGSQHIGDNYSVNGLSISDSKARSTTLYELAQTAKNLSLQKGA